MDSSDRVRRAGERRDRRRAGSGLILLLGFTSTATLWATAKWSQPGVAELGEAGEHAATPRETPSDPSVSFQHATTNVARRERIYGARFDRGEPEPDDDEGRFVEGIVRSSSGRRLANVRIFAAGLEPFETMTDERGKFRCGPFAGSGCRIEFRHERHIGLARFVNLMRRQQMEVTLRELPYATVRIAARRSDLSHRVHHLAGYTSLAVEYSRGDTTGPWSWLDRSLWSVDPVGQEGRFKLFARTHRYLRLTAHVSGGEKARSEPFRVLRDDVPPALDLVSPFGTTDRR